VREKQRSWSLSSQSPLLGLSKAATALDPKRPGAKEGEVLFVQVLDPGADPEVGVERAMEKAFLLVFGAEDHLVFAK